MTTSTTGERGGGWKTMAIGLLAMLAATTAFARPDPGGGFHGGGGRDFDGAPGGRQSRDARQWHARREPTPSVRRESSNDSSSPPRSRSKTERSRPRASSTERSSSTERTQRALEEIGRPFARALGLHPHDPAERRRERDQANRLAAAAIVTAAPLSKPMQFLNGFAGPTPPTTKTELGGWAVGKLLEERERRELQQRRSDPPGALPDGRYPAGEGPPIVVVRDPLTGSLKIKRVVRPHDPYVQAADLDKASERIGESLPRLNLGGVGQCGGFGAGR